MNHLLQQLVIMFILCNSVARRRDNTVNPMLDGSDDVKATPYSYGSGHIRPNRAQDPGLVYDVSINDYLDFLCALGYNNTMIELFSEGPYKCPRSASVLDFNYPSISVPKLSSAVTVTRKVKNVGLPGKYEALIREPYGISVTVEPNTLAFENTGDEKSFSVTFVPKWPGDVDVFGVLTWTDGSHYVRSPIVVANADV